MINIKMSYAKPDVLDIKLSKVSADIPTKNSFRGVTLAGIIQSKSKGNPF